MLPIDALQIPDFVRLVDRGNDQAAHSSLPTCWHFEDPLPAVVALLLADVTGAFYDVGANTGFYSVLVGKAAPELPIRAFEPVPAIAALCEENLALNRVDAKVEQVALSDSSGETTIYLPSDAHGLVETSASLNPEFKQMASSFTIPTRTLDSVAAEQQVGLVKIDVESFEHVVLRGAMATFRRDRPLAVLEVLPQGDAGALQAMLEDLDYRWFALLPGMQVEQRDSLRFDPDSWNHLVVPAERAETVGSLLESGKSRYEKARVAAVTQWSEVASAEDFMAVHAAVDADVRRREQQLRPKGARRWLRRR